jgi:2-oxo-4-hydroxy-4-carboxy-5-ureidoimidazoline decarboxylase
MIAIAAADRLDRDAFVAHFGGVFEGSPWIAREAWEERPFGSVEALHAAMVRVVERSPRSARLELIRAHPELAGRTAVAVELTPESTREQSAAGLDRLTPRQHERISGLTAAYRERFGFPFVICAREHTADSIIGAAARRLAARPEEEEPTALSEIARIARLRLGELVEP